MAAFLSRFAQQVPITCTCGFAQFTSEPFNSVLAAFFRYSIRSLLSSRKGSSLSLLFILFIIKDKLESEEFIVIFEEGLI